MGYKQQTLLGLVAQYMEDYALNTACRVCQGTDLTLVLDLGATPPANAYLKDADLKKPEASFPLALYHCRDCSLLQLLHVVDPEILFKDYHYATGTSPQLFGHFKKYAEEAILPLITSPDDLVVDIGGNDGVLLSFIKDKARVLNVDPADNLAPLSEERGVPFYPAFFTSKVAESIVKEFGHAKVVTANNVMAHTDPLRDVFLGVSKLIGEDGTFVFEVHWQKHLLEETAFDQIYHEHLCFHSLRDLMHLVESASMSVHDAQVVSSQGLSLRVFAAKGRPQSARVAQILEEEKRHGVGDENALTAFRARVEAGKETLVALLRQLKAQGKKIAGYGATAKSGTMLNYYGIGVDTISYVTDTSPLKQGLYTPGTHIPIVSPERLITDTPDYILLLAWNFKDSILAKEQALRDKGIKFIVTVPKVEVL